MAENLRLAGPLLPTGNNEESVQYRLIRYARLTRESGGGRRRRRRNASKKERQKGRPRRPGSIAHRERREMPPVYTRCPCCFVVMSSLTPRYGSDSLDESGLSLFLASAWFLVVSVVFVPAARDLKCRASCCPHGCSIIIAPGLVTIGIIMGRSKARQE